MSAAPPWPRVLGIVALMPQMACVIAAYMGPPEWREAAHLIAMFYAAVILGFLGGGWWGIAASAPAAERRHGLGWLWLAALLAMLAGFACVIGWALEWLPLEPLLVMLGAALSLCLIVDARISVFTPRWWAKSRAPLSLGAGAATILIALN